MANALTDAHSRRHRVGVFFLGDVLGLTSRDGGSCSRQSDLSPTAAAFAEDPTHKAVREVLARSVSNPTAVLKGLGEPQRAEIQKIFHSDALTILNVVWAPGMMVMPHNHRMWAAIGIYTGREDNVFWRRVKEAPNKIEAAGAKALCEMDAEPLGTDIIHSVINPINKLTGAIHVYGAIFSRQSAVNGIP